MYRFIFTFGNGQRNGSGNVEFKWGTKTIILPFNVNVFSFNGTLDDFHEKELDIRGINFEELTITPLHKFRDVRVTDSVTLQEFKENYKNSL